MVLQTMKSSSLPDLGDGPRISGPPRQRPSGMRRLLASDPAAKSATRSSSVKDLSELFDTAPSKKSSFSDMRKVFSKVPQSPTSTKNTTNASFTASYPAMEANRGVAILQKRLQEYCDKFRNQEARHIQERLTWQAQTVELQRLRKERDDLLKEKSERTSFARETQEKKEAVDWAKQIEILKEVIKSKDQQLGCLRAQLDEKTQELEHETALNTESMMELQGCQAKLVRENSQKDMKIEELEEQLKMHNSKGSIKFDMGEKSTADEIAALPLQVELGEQEKTPLMTESFSQSEDSSIKKDQQIEQLKSKLHESQSQLVLAEEKNEVLESKMHNIESQWKSEVENAKIQNKQELDEVKDKLLGKLAQIQKERRELQELKNGVMSESAKAMAGMADVQELVDALWAKVAELEAENAALKGQSAPTPPQPPSSPKKKKTKSRSKSREKRTSKTTSEGGMRRKLKRKESVSKLDVSQHSVQTEQ